MQKHDPTKNKEYAQNAIEKNKNRCIAVLV